MAVALQERANYLWVDCRAWVAQYMAKYDPRSKIGLPASSQDEVSPSSGWLGTPVTPPGEHCQSHSHLIPAKLPTHQWKIVDSGQVTDHGTRALARPALSHPLFGIVRSWR